MTKEELNVALYNKMLDEQEEFKEKLMKLSPKEIMFYAYELVIREDILLSLEEMDLEEDQANALLKEPEPLKRLYLRWEKCESNHMEEIRNLIEDYANQGIYIAKRWTDLLDSSVYSRFANCCSKRSDILPLAQARWLWLKNIKATGYCKEDALVYVLEMLEINSIEISLTRHEYDEILNSIN